MGANAKYFSKQGVTLDDIIKYLQSRFTDVNVDLAEQNLFDQETKTIFGNLRFADNGQSRSIFVYIPGYATTTENSENPVPSIAGESISLNTSISDEDVAILNDIAKEFGGYVCKNDRDADDPDYWVYIEGPKERSTGEQSIEGKLFNLYSTYCDKANIQYSQNIRNSANFNFMVRFIKDNLDEIKKL